MKVKVLLFSLIAFVFVACGPKDAQINSMVQTQLEQISKDIQVSTENGVVTLNGEVGHGISLDQIMTAIKSIKGVKEVVNNVTVKAEEPVISPDSQLSGAITTLINSNANFKNVVCHVENGEVNLTGEIKKANLQTLIEAVHALSPKKVNNNLTIK